MTKWEYKWFALSDGYMAAAGAAGWEIFAIYNGSCLAKRPIPPALDFMPSVCGGAARIEYKDGNRFRRAVCPKGGSHCGTAWFRTLEEVHEAWNSGIAEPPR